MSAKRASPTTGSWPLVKCAVSHWMSDDAASIGAALAFYCAFSLAPLLVIVVNVVSWLIGAELAYGHLETQLNALFGAGTTRILVAAMQSANSAEGAWATAVSVASLLIGATTVFSALESALEQIWGVRNMIPTGMMGFIRTRLLSFGVILAVGFLLLVSLTISTALAAIKKYVSEHFAALAIVTGVLDFVVSLGLITLLIALIYRYMPVRRLSWRPTLWGALITALLFQLGRWGIGLYLGKSTQPSAFGAAASFAALLLWLYYTAQIFLLGAEFTACLGGLRKGEARAALADRLGSPQKD